MTVEIRILSKLVQINTAQQIEWENKDAKSIVKTLMDRVIIELLNFVKKPLIILIVLVLEK